MTRRTTMAFFVLAGLVLGLTAIPNNASAEDDSLIAAYRKEFAFLAAEKASLQGRLADQESIAAAKINAAKNELGKLRSTLVGTSDRVAAAEEELAASGQTTESLAEAVELLDATISQATSTLQTNGVKVEDIDLTHEGAVQTALDAVFGDATRRLAELSSVRSEPGEYFLADGRKATGTITRIGRVAAVASGEKSGVLAPAGDGQFKLWEGGDAKAAAAFTQGQAPESLGLFLFSNLDKAVELPKEKTIFDVVDSGGVIAYVIVILGMVALVLILFRAMALSRAAAGMDRLVDAVTPLVDKGELDKAAGVCADASGSVSRVLEATIRHLGVPREKLDDVISEHILHEVPTLDRFGSAILVAASVAPLLGLLGTVTGMISTFDIITEFGTGDPKLLSGGISEALVTTELGLIVAIPALLIGTLLSGYADRIKDAMETSALRVANRYERRDDDEDRPRAAKTSQAA
ncbi:MAG: MotA/TolQ/ExbB proton channel family protein [Deltaproteobacteria bacterium]|nr:MotA/TolQ/ExbB proton channel family protein [Deltaproteobacteria bacterium]MCB9488717.1 MotA/TolQ/ExbB proton channel family protein [Deltaproteobacteria bacterium]